ncbi:Sigma-54 dependent response regulator [Cystobacter fuscus DSM 2262]|uniref:Sigma-54 dependent response regulator n=1 Tax=Cystobacter fuscus (strain ATCC 25194 / DSM 2262 / NBRC 100088 / M29) TaxID=1242864 RepID=S9PCV4_CYSF2|nr:sigma 54-interacting transcriptional regulator [Cystobacter fuscus]EPX62210.1 Sigma-54 dependent response regulator [Cystobacter fuscus DSM 2262]
MVVETGPDARRDLPLEGTLLVGTQVEGGLRLSDPTVSRVHLELQARPEGVRVRDVGSRNGTWSLGVRIHEVTVAGEARFTLGKTTLLVLPETTEEAAEPAPLTTFGRALGQSAAMQKLFGVLERTARSSFSVLLLGETGTGKELLAEAIHRASPRNNQPFVIVDCGAVVPSLIESELFGHAKGAFTGAHAERQGHLVQADGGTVFLDEVGELPLELQPKLLRVLESGTVRRVGDNAAKDVDVRVVAATHRDLKAEVAAGRFRADLYYRLAVVPVRVPALRERAEDIPLLARHLFQQAGQPDFPLTEELVQRLVGYDWPGNVRELRNFVHRVLAAGDAELPDARPVSAVTATEDLSGLTFKEAKERMVEAFTREYLTALLARCGNNISEVARTAGMARSHVHGLLNRYGLKAGD